MSTIKAHLLATSRNVRFLQVALQVAVVGLGALVVWWLLGNLQDSLVRKKQDLTDVSFLNRKANFKAAEGFDPDQPVWHQLLNGLQNTVLAATVGIAIATVLGVIIGIARLSHNWLASKLAQLYVETFRNIPALVIISFFYYAIFLNTLPVIEGARELKPSGSNGNWLILSNQWIAVPSLIAENGYILFWILAAAAMLAAGMVWRWRSKVFTNTGKPHHRVLWTTGVLAALVATAFLALDAPFSWSWPTIIPESDDNRTTIAGGFSIGISYLSVTLALGLYTASHIAEIVRGAILAVPKGQTEASASVALNSYQKYRFVVLPQAMRIAVPAITNNYLNLTKNTSLGVVVAYAELASVTRSSYNNGSPAPQAILIMMCAYLMLSLIISLLANGVNYKLKLKER